MHIWDNTFNISTTSFLSWRYQDNPLRLPKNDHLGLSTYPDDLDQVTDIESRSLTPATTSSHFQVIRPLLPSCTSLVHGPWVTAARDGRQLDLGAVRIRSTSPTWVQTRARIRGITPSQLYIVDSFRVMGNCSIRRVLRMCGISRGHTLLGFMGTFWSALVFPL